MNQNQQPRDDPNRSQQEIYITDAGGVLVAGAPSPFQNKNKKINNFQNLIEAHTTNSVKNYQDFS